MFVIITHFGRWHTVCKYHIFWHSVSLRHASRTWSKKSEAACQTKLRACFKIYQARRKKRETQHQTMKTKRCSDSESNTCFHIILCQSSTEQKTDTKENLAIRSVVCILHSFKQFTNWNYLLKQLQNSGALLTLNIYCY